MDLRSFVYSLFVHGLYRNGNQGNYEQGHCDDRDKRSVRRYADVEESVKLKRTLRDIWYAVTRPDAYREFMNYRKRNLIFHVLTLMLISCLLTMVLPAARFLSDGGFGRILEERVPDFKVANGEFWIEKPVEIDEYNFLIKANSDVVREDIQDLDGQYGSYDYVIMVDKEQIYLKTMGMQELTARFDEMKDLSFSKEDMLSYVPVLYVVYVWVFVLANLMDFGYYFLTALVSSWIAGVIASFMKLRIGSAPLFKMSVYAGTTTYLVGLAQAVLGKYIPNFSVFGHLITLGYLYFALKDYKDSLGTVNS